MKLWIGVLLLAPTVAVACPTGMSEWNKECVVDIQPEIAPSVKPSDEKPPDDKMPSYQRADVKVIDVPSTATDDIKLDQEKAAADAEGKRAAGIK